jgi:hypothetical protein
MDLKELTTGGAVGSGFARQATCGHGRSTCERITQVKVHGTLCPHPSHNKWSYNLSATARDMALRCGNVTASEPLLQYVQINYES